MQENDVKLLLAATGAMRGLVMGNERLEVKVPERIPAIWVRADKWREVKRRRAANRVEPTVNAEIEAKRIEVRALYFEETQRREKERARAQQVKE